MVRTEDYTWYSIMNYIFQNIQKNCETNIFSLCLCRRSCVKNLSRFSGGRKNHLLTKHVSSEIKWVIPKYVIFSTISKYAQNCCTWLNAHTKHDCRRILKKNEFCNLQSTGAADCVYTAVLGVWRGFPMFIDTCNMCRSIMFVLYPLWSNAFHTLIVVCGC
jgi:hypothetical protein